MMEQVPRRHHSVSGVVVMSLVVLACGSTPTDSNADDGVSPPEDAGALSGQSAGTGEPSGPDETAEPLGSNEPSTTGEPESTAGGAGGATGSGPGQQAGPAEQDGAAGPGTTLPATSRRPSRIVVKGRGDDLLGESRDLYAMNLDGSEPVRFSGLDSLYSVAARGSRVMLIGSRVAGEGPLFYDVDGSNEVDLRDLDYDLGPILMSSGKTFFFTTQKVEDTLPVWVAETDGSEPTKVADVRVTGNTNLIGGSASRDLFLFDRFVLDAESVELFELPAEAAAPTPRASWSPSGDRIAYLATKTTGESGSDLTLWQADDRTTQVIASTTALANGQSSPVWSRNERYLGVSAQDSSSEQGLFLTGVGQGSRWVAGDGGVRAISDDGWFLVSRLVNGSEVWLAYDLAAGEVELFDDTTRNLASSSGYLAGCDPGTGELELKAANGTTAAMLQATPDCILTWSHSSHYLAYVGDGGLYVFETRSDQPVEITRPAGFGSVTRLSSIEHGDGFTVVSETEPNTWIYLEEGTFRVADPAIVFRYLDDAAFGGFSE